MLQDFLSRYCLPRAARAVVRPYHCIMLYLFIENKMFPLLLLRMFEYLSQNELIDQKHQKGFWPSVDGVG